MIFGSYLFVMRVVSGWLPITSYQPLATNQNEHPQGGAILLFVLRPMLFI